MTELDQLRQRLSEVEAERDAKSESANDYYRQCIGLREELTSLRADQERMREALVQIQRLDFHGKLVPAAGWYVLGAELMPIVSAALSTPRQP